MFTIKKKEPVKIENLGQVIKEIYPYMDEKLRTASVIDQQIQIIRDELVACIDNNDLLRALAIVDYVTHTTDITSKNLNLIGESGETPEPISSIACEMGNDDWAIDFMGYCKALNYTEEF